MVGWLSTLRYGQRVNFEEAEAASAIVIVMMSIIKGPVEEQ